VEPDAFAAHFALEDGHWWFRAKRALVADLLGRYGGRPRRVLDVGCGTGGMLRALAGEGGPPAGDGAAPGLAAVGIDAAPLALALSRRRGVGRLVGGLAEALPFRDGAFEACLCLDVLYHRGVVSEARALGECHRVLRPGGLLVVTDSAFAWLRSAHDVAVHGARRYTRRQLVAAVRAAGFTPLFASYAYCLVFPAVAAVRLARRGRRGASDVFGLPPSLNRLLLGIQAVERRLLRLTPLPFGSSVVVVARKGGAG
jgi:ubiquinone/menaquinone biosynthesis C-methylase UbiE